MNGMQIFSCLFILISSAHVIFILLQKEKLRRISKVCVIPPLLGVCLLGAGKLLLLPAAALVFGWIGDIALINIRRRINFVVGLLSFLLGHVCYTAAFIDFIGSTGNINIPAALIYIPLAVFCGVVVIRFIHPNREMFILVVIYTVIIITMSFWGFQLMLFRRDLAGLLIFAGCLCFLTSDIMLGYFTFRKLKLWGAVLIMVFYILAQAGIIYGFLGF